MAVNEIRIDRLIRSGRQPRCNLYRDCLLQTIPLVYHQRRTTRSENVMPPQIMKFSAVLAGLALTMALLGCGDSGERLDSANSGVESSKTEAPEKDLDNSIRHRRETGETGSDPGGFPAAEFQEDLVRKLGRLKPGAEMDQAIADLAQRRDATVDDIERLSPELSSDFGWVHTSVRILEKINTEKSRGVLKKIALDEIEVENPGLRGWAAQALINCDPNQARELLSTSRAEVLEAAINSLRGKGMDQALFNLLKPHIEGGGPLTRWRAASIMASESPPGELADQALKCIVKALVAVEEIPDLDRIDPSTGHVNYQMTVGEWHYHAYAGMLHQVKVENPALHETTKQLQGRARDTVVLSLAYRHDKSVHDEIVKLAQDEDAGMFRAWAAAALTDIGTTGDLPLLQKLSKTDPLKRSGGGFGTRSNFPVRESAKNAINTFELRAKQK